MEYDEMTDTNTSESREDFLQYKIGNYIWIYVSPVVLIIGTFGNTLSIIVLLRKSMRSSTTMFYLTALSFGDLLSLYTGLLRYWISNTFQVDIRHTSDFGCQLHTFIVYSSLDFTVWILVAVTIDRCLSVSIPFKAKRVCSIRRSRIYVTVIVAMIIIKNMHFFWHIGLVDTWEFRCDGVTEAATMFLRFVWVWIDFCTFCLIPFSIMIGCNVKIIHQMIASQRKLEAYNGTIKYSRTISLQSHTSQPGPSTQSNNSPTQSAVSTVDVNGINSGGRRISSLTTMLLTINCVFLVTTSPIQAFLIGEEHWFEARTAEDNAWYNFWFAIVNILQYLNNAVHFFLYCLTGPKFRQELKALFQRHQRVGHHRDQSRTNET